MGALSGLSTKVLANVVIRGLAALVLERGLVFVPGVRLDQRAALNLAVAAMHSLLEERLLYVIGYQVQVIGLVGDKETELAALLGVNTSRDDNVNVELLTHHGGIHDHGTELDVGAREEGLVVVGVKLELETPASSGPWTTYPRS